MKQKVVTFGEIMLRLAPEGYYRFVQADTFGATYGGGEANVAVSLANYMKQKVVTFGEIMLRLAPEGYYRFVQADTFGATYGGGEANVAVSLANYGFDAKYVTRLPNHEIGQCAINSLRKYGVDTSYIARGGDRIGIYYLEKGASQYYLEKDASQRPSKVIYDRAGSSIYTATSADFNWDEIFKDCAWFHITGITPALCDNVSKLTIEACKKAKEHGVKISCDLNYRNKLWSKEKAGEVMAKICEYVDVLLYVTM